ncbi:MAG: OsmC family protein [Balneolaceae bacterium]|nr:OsmC family protein [Balneolaceae bacterium]MCH8550007.1 OsmC family protein [Balneolaceae bacterium]
MPDSNEHFYNIDINWNRDKIGTASSPELDEEITVATPPQFPGGVVGVWSPEHLFVAAVSSCFMTSFTAIAEYSKFSFESLKVESSGKMSKENGKFVMSEIILKPLLEISDPSFEKKAFRLLEKAEQICLITRSIKSDVTMQARVEVVVSRD